jgi:hypothetical protein
LLVEVLVYNLGLAISLKIEYSRELNLNSEDTVEFVLEIRYKLGATVGYN